MPLPLTCGPCATVLIEVPDAHHPSVDAMLRRDHPNPAMLEFGDKEVLSYDNRHTYKFDAQLDGHYGEYNDEWDPDEAVSTIYDEVSRSLRCSARKLGDEVLLEALDRPFVHEGIAEPGVWPPVTIHIWVTSGCTFRPK